MTTGQRIAQKRKELGFSQEALGEKLGVSRQSIYKWESDSALPEIEKLVALSRLFGVSVGWLLGVEEEAPSGGAELTEAQLKMIEEIAVRYAPGRRLSSRRLAVLKVSAVAAALCLCGVLYGFHQRLKNLNASFAYLATSADQLERSVNTQISAVSSRVEEILKSQNDLTADYGSELVRVDLSQSTALFHIYAVPKSYVEGMTAEFTANSVSSAVTVSQPDGQRFEADLRCGLAEEITLSVVFLYPDGSRQTQVLDRCQGLYGQTFPRVQADLSLGQRAVADGVLLLSGANRIYLNYGPDTDSGLPVAEAESLRVGLFKNRKLVSWAVFQPGEGVEEETEALTGAQWEALQALRRHGPSGTHGYQLLTAIFPDGETAVEPGDVLETAVVIRDVYGRTAVRAGTAYGLNETQGVLNDLGLEPPDAYPGGWMLEDGRSICEIQP